MANVEILDHQVVLKIGKEMLGALEKALPPIVTDEMALIKRRTQGGKDVSGANFKKYTPAYAKYRELRGRNTTPVDLWLEGDMMEAMEVKPLVKTNTSYRVDIGFASVRESRKAIGNMRYRQFFGLSDDQKKRITDRLTKATTQTS